MLKKTFLFSVLQLIICCYSFAQFPVSSEEREDEWKEDTLKKQDAVTLLKILSEVKAKQSKKNKIASTFSSFSEKGPINYPGRINCLLVDDVHNIYLAGTSSGGVWRFVPDRSVYNTTNSFTNNTAWYKVNDFELSLSISSIVQSPTDYNTIYYATGDARVYNGVGIYKSTNGGTSFSLLPASSPSVMPSSTIHSMEIDPNNGNLYVGLYHSVYRSTDGGASFNEVFAGDFYAGAVKSIFFNASGEVMISVDKQGIFKSPTGAAGTFVQLTNGITNADGTSSSFYVKMAGCTSQRDVVYAQFSSTAANSYLDGIYKTTDGGISWTQIGDPKSIIDYNQAFHAFVLSVKPGNPNILVSGGVTIAYSMNGGITWQKVMNVGIDHTSAVWEKNNSSVYFTCDHGVYFHYDDTKLNDQLNRSDLARDGGGLNNLQCYYGDYFPTGDGVVYGAQDNQSCVIRKNSNKAYYYGGGDGFNVFTHKQDTNVVYGSIQYGLLVRCDSVTPKGIYYPYTTASNYILSNLDANSDNKPDEGHQFYTQFWVSERNSNNLFFPTNSRLYVSKDRGDSWTPMTGSLPLSNCVLTSDDESSPTVYFSTSNIIYRLDNALNPASSGTQTTLTTSLQTYDVAEKIEVDPNDHNKLYYALKYNSTGSPKLCRFDNVKTGTLTMNDISGDLDITVNDIAVLPGNSNIIFAATDIGIFYTENAGTNWTLVEEFPNVKVSDLKFRESDKKLFIFTFGRGAWIATLNGALTAVRPDKAQEAIASVFPNPSSDYIKIRTGSNNPSEVFILDVNGREYKHEAHYMDESSISIANLQSGLYIAKYRSGESWKYQTFIKK